MFFPSTDQTADQTVLRRRVEKTQFENKEQFREKADAKAVLVLVLELGEQMGKR